MADFVVKGCKRQYSALFFHDLSLLVHSNDSMVSGNMHSVQPVAQLLRLSLAGELAYMPGAAACDPRWHVDTPFPRPQ